MGLEKEWLLCAFYDAQLLSSSSVLRCDNIMKMANWEFSDLLKKSQHSILQYPVELSTKSCRSEASMCEVGICPELGINARHTFTPKSKLF